MKKIKETLAGFFRIQIELENTASPIEAISYIQTQRNKDKALNAVLDKTEKMMLQASDEIKKFKRRKVSKNVSFYSTEKPKEHLLICFCGRANRLMMPIPVFLQYINDEIYDVLILMDPSGLCFHSGIPELGENLKESIDELENIISISNYQNITTFGTSGGGCASLFLGVYLNAKQAISIGGRHPDNYTVTNTKLIEKGLSGKEFDQLISKNINNSSTQIQLVFAENNISDKMSAQTFSTKFKKINLVPISDTDEHNVLAFLMNKSRLSMFFNALF
jgi:hypothetical protein